MRTSARRTSLITLSRCSSTETNRIVFAKPRRLDLRLIRNAENRGFCAGNNQGFAALRGEFVALLNNDAEAEPGWLAALPASLTATVSRGDLGYAWMPVAGRPALVVAGRQGTGPAFYFVFQTGAIDAALADLARRAAADAARELEPFRWITSYEAVRARANIELAALQDQVVAGAFAAARRRAGSFEKSPRPGRDRWEAPFAGAGGDSRRRNAELSGLFTRLFTLPSHHPGIVMGVKNKSW